MNVKELGDYNFWLKTTPADIALQVQYLGGWKTIFPNKLPRWASKVRNYFNLLPNTLKRVPRKQAKVLLERMQTFSFLLDCHAARTANRTFRNYKQNPDGSYDKDPFEVAQGCPVDAEYDVKHTGAADSVAVKNAFSGQVYLDERGGPWYQMSPGSTIYHWGREPYHHWIISWIANPIEAIWVDRIRGQNDTPVFKLVSPDGTGGSREMILLNDGVSAYTLGGGSEAVAAEGETVNIRNIVLSDPAYQGSYNYSETAKVGLAAHKTRDVEPHVPGRNFYVNPPDPFAPLDRRKFPTLDLANKPLVGQN